MLYLLAIALCVAADQAVKLYVVGRLALFEAAPLLPGFVELLYIQNTGGGFSILENHTWLLTVVILVVCGTIGFAAYYMLLHDKITAKKENDCHETGGSTGQ